MKRLLIVFLIAGPAACFVDPPAKDSAAFLCEDNVDCASGYTCISRDGGAKICVSESPCGSPADCPDGFTCEGNPARCWPANGCRSSDQCPQEKPFCRGGACIDPCAEDPCHATPDLRCERLGEDPGYACKPCRDTGCPTGLVCAVLDANGGEGCRPGCGVVGESCTFDANAQGKCAWVPGFAAGTATDLKACAPCPLNCDTSACTVYQDPTVVEARPWTEAAFCECAAHSDCATTEWCVVRNAEHEACEPRCPTAGNPCTRPDALPGRCTNIRDYSGGLSSVCVGCDLPCSAGTHCSVSTTAPDRLESVERECYCDPTVCSSEGEGFHCAPVASPIMHECTTACTVLSDCPDPLVCDANACKLPAVGCNDGDPVAPEVCDDGALNGGWCRPDCSGPECDWGLVFSNASLGNNVTFADKIEYDMGSNFTIEMRLRFPSLPSGVMPILTRKGASGPFYRIYFDQSLKVEVYSTSAVNGTIASSEAININTVYNVAVVRSGQTITWYINGVATDSGTITGLPAIDNSAPLVLGSLASSSQAAIFGIDDLRLFSKSRTEADLQGARSCGHIQDTNLVGEWLFDYALSTYPSGGPIVDTSNIANSAQVYGVVTGGLVQ